MFLRSIFASLALFALFSLVAVAADPIRIDVTAAPYNCDPSGTRDATQCVDWAVEALVTNLEGGVLYFPSGKYLFNSDSDHYYRLAFIHIDTTSNTQPFPANAMFQIQGQSRSTTTMVYNTTIFPSFAYINSSPMNPIPFKFTGFTLAPFVSDTLDLAPVLADDDIDIATDADVDGASDEVVVTSSRAGVPLSAIYVSNTRNSLIEGILIQLLPKSTMTGITVTKSAHIAMRSMTIAGPTALVQSRGVVLDNVTDVLFYSNTQIGNLNIGIHIVSDFDMISIIELIQKEGVLTGVQVDGSNRAPNTVGLKIFDAIWTNLPIPIGITSKVLNISVEDAWLYGTRSSSASQPNIAISTPQQTTLALNLHKVLIQGFDIGIAVASNVQQVYMKNVTIAGCNYGLDYEPTIEQERLVGEGELEDVPPLLTVTETNFVSMDTLAALIRGQSITFTSNTCEGPHSQTVQFDCQQQCNVGVNQQCTFVP